MLKACRSIREDNLNANPSIAAAVCAALFLSACAPTPQSLILGKWQVASTRVNGAETDSPIKMTAEFNPDGTAKITMFGQTLQGTFKFSGDELEWSMNGQTTKSKASVTATDLELTDDQNRTIIYKRK
jgi:hypothetical protein